MGLKSLTCFTAVLFVGAGLGVVPVAQAQQEQAQQTEPYEYVDEIPRGETVTSRPRPELDALGIRMGSFLVFPEFDLDELYNDNIFSVESDKDDDFITVIRPGLDIRSDWNNHALNFSGQADIGRYADWDEENYEDFDVSLDGRFDITRDINIFANVAYFALHEDRGSPDDVSGSSPTEFSIFLANAQYFHQLNRLNFTLDLTTRDFDYDDSPTAGIAINNDDRDRFESNISFRVGYEIVPEYEAFIRLGGNDRSYDDAPDDAGFDRDSFGYEIAAGVSVDLGGIAFGDVFVGYQRQSYGDAALKAIGSPVLGAELTWNVTRLSTLTGGIEQNIEETTQGSASGFLATRLHVTADHELLRNLILNANLAATTSDYTGIDREDRFYEAGLGAKYMLNRNLYGSVTYSYRQRESDFSTGADSDYKQNIFMIRLEAQM